MEVRVLGAIEVRTDGRVLTARRPQQDAVLAALAVDAGRPVSTAALADRVWGVSPPAQANRAVQTHITRIRRQLDQLGPPERDEVRLVRRGGGYVLEIDPERVDLHRFRRLVERARRPGQSADERVEALRGALTLWRGDALSGVPGEWAARVRDGCRQQYLDAVLDWAEAELDIGRPHAVISPLTELVGHHPLTEPLVAALMRALYAAGRTAEALATFAATRQRLVEELGVDPGADLRALHQAILRGEPARPAVPEPAGPAPPPREVPAQLPLRVPGFTGRRAELARLDALLTDAFDDGSEVVVAAISGTAGVGKTALAVHWAHAVADRFPDGQIYVNLRGFDPAGAVVTPAEAIRGFLDALGAPPERVPADLDRQSALYRTLLAGRRMLILLDNARDTGHARPLLPGTAGCLVLVTSRHLLSGLIADGAHPIELDLLSTAEARQLLSRRLGADRVAAESAAVDKIIARCVRLPLALAVATARAATRARWGLASLAAELDDVRRRLDTLVGDDPATDLRAVFSWSYRCLSPAAARLFRLLSLHPGPDTSGPAAASLAAVPLAELLPAVAELADAHLLVEHQPGRYACHDLLRAYAAEQVEATETGDVRDAAVGRMLDHYLHTAHAGNQLMNRARERLTVAAVGPGVVPEQLTEAEQARDWFRAEHRVLLGAVEQAAATGHDVHAWQLAWTLWTFLEWRGHWHEWATTGRTALDAAQRLADPVAEATAHRFLANAATRLGRFDDARTHLRHALDLYRRVGDQSGQARVHVNISSLWERQGRHPEALHHNRQALDLFRTTGYKPGLAVVLNNIGWLYAHLGDHQQSLEHCREAVVLQQALGNQHGEASAWDSLGYARHRLGQYGEALACFHRATEMYRDIGDHYRVADTLVHLADTHLAMGDPQAAGDARREALSLLDSLNHPGAAELRARLMPPTPPRQRRG